jgi:hypothetical protein
MNKRGSVADRMAFFRQALEEEKKENTAKRLSKPSLSQVSSSTTNSSASSPSIQTQMNESNEQMNSAESTAKKPEKVASQRKE